MNNDYEQITKWAKDVLLSEGHSLISACENINNDFAKICNKIYTCQGKLIITGMGKSGYIAKKIAATLMSTGTAAMYLHPGEAQHGDLGCIQKQDILCAITYGGETEEVINTVNYANQKELFAFGITGNINSTLAKKCGYVLNAQVLSEADDLGIVPTNSSTLTLALGDALAVALMKLRNFDEKDFALYHPGGNIGRNLSSVSEYMRKIDNSSLIYKDADFHTVLQASTKHNTGLAGVINKKKELIGAISDGDIRRLLIKHNSSALEKKASDIMSHNPITVSENFLAIKALSLMNNKNKCITKLFVINENNQVVGILHLHDLLTAKFTIANNESSK